MPDKTLFVSIPSLDGKMEDWMDKQLTKCLIFLEEKGWKIYRDRPEIGSNIAKNRNRAVPKAKVSGASHILWVDTDVVFLADDAIWKLTEDNKDIVSGMVFGKQPPFVPIMSYFEGGFYKNYEEPLRGELVETDGVGGGALLVKMEVFESIKHPYFNFDTVYPHREDTPYSMSEVAYCKTQIKMKEAAKKIDEFQREHACSVLKVPTNLLMDFYELAGYCVTGYAIGEDYGFCRRAKAAGYSIWVDTTIPIGHCGRYMFNIADFIRHFNQCQGIKEESKPLIEVVP